MPTQMSNYEEIQALQSGTGGLFFLVSLGSLVRRSRTQKVFFKRLIDSIITIQAFKSLNGNNKYVRFGKKIHMKKSIQDLM